MSYLGDYETDVVYDLGFASELVCNLHWMARKVDDYEASRAAAQRTASEGFKGAFSTVFSGNMHNAHLDSLDLSSVLDAVADRIDYLIHEVQKENRRRQHIRDYMAEHDSFLSSVWDWFTGTSISPFPAEIRPNLPSQYVLALHPRDHSRTGTIASMEVSSAHPSRLRSAATTIIAACDRVSGIDALISDLDEYPSRCQYASVEIGDLPRNLRLWMEANRADSDWLNVVAQAFEEAGGSGDFSVSLSNSALLAALEAHAISLTRQPLDITAPTLAGLDPATGYVLDPVNATTGSFIEPEVDLSFTGGSATLALTRMYNSLGGGSGVFGPNWSSVLDQCLCIEDEQARWIRDDGRHILFPRYGTGFERAVQDHYWCDRIPVNQLPTFIQRSVSTSCDECFVLTNNRGDRWFFDDTGVWLGEGSEEGSYVRTQHDENGALITLIHERGRQIDCEYSDGQCVKVRASDGRELEYVYDEDQRLVSVHSHLGKRRYILSAHGLIEQVISANGVREVTNRYDEVGRVISQVTDCGREVRFSYLPGGITEVADTDGSRANTWISNAQGRLVGIIDSEGNRQSMSYDACGNCVAATGRDGAVTVHLYDQRGRRTRTVLPTGGEFTFAWDEHDRLSTLVNDAGAIVQYLYATTQQRHPSVIVDPLGGETSLTWDQGLLREIVDPMGVRVSFAYDTCGDLVSVMNAAGDCVQIIRDEAGRACQTIAPDGGLTRCDYDQWGRPKKVTHPDGASWSYEYAGSHVTAVIDPYGARTDITYGEHGLPLSVTDPLGRTTSRVLDDCGNIASLLLPDGAEFSFVHDALSRLREVHAPDGGLWRQDWDAIGNLTCATDPTGVSRLWERHSSASSAHHSGQETPGYGMEFDHYGRPTRWTGPAGDEGVITYDLAGHPVEFLDAHGGLTQFKRDLAGRLVEQVSPEGISLFFTYDACGRVDSVRDACGLTRFEYDSCSRVVKKISPTGEESQFSYDLNGRLLEARIPGVGRSRYRYDLTGRVVFSREPLTGIRRFSYDQAGQLVRAENGVGGVTSYEYDSAGRLTTVIDPAGGVTKRTYDAMGRLVTFTDPLGNITHTTYDAAGRLLTQRGPDGVETSFTYSSSGERESVRVNGEVLTRIERDVSTRTVRLVDYTHPDGHSTTHELSFDHAGRLLSRQRERAGEVTRAKWEYDRDGRRVAFSDVDGRRTTYGYASSGNLHYIDHPLRGRVDLIHDEAGRVVRVSHAERSQHWNYIDGQLSTHSFRDNTVLPTTHETPATHVTYDTWGRITTVEEAGVLYTYSYDDAHQLRQVTSSLGQENHWMYDQAGRLVQCVLDGVETTFVYDQASQLIETITDGVSTCHEYDVRGRRICSTSSDGGRTRYSWDTRNWLTQITHQRPESPSFTHRLWVDGIGELSSVDDCSLTWDTAASLPTVTSVNGNPYMLLPGAGHIDSSSDWEIPGVSSWRSARSHIPSNPWSMALGGGLGGTDAVHVSAHGTPVISGVEWMGARVYDPATHHFLTRDPLSPITGSVWESNPYNYAANNPLNAIDPLGLRPVTDAQLNEYNSVYNKTALGKVRGWLVNSWEYIVGGATLIAGVALMFTGVGGPAGIALLALSDGSTMGGISIIEQKSTESTVDWQEVGISTALGAASGALGAIAGEAMTVATMGTRWSPLAVNIAENVGENIPYATHDIVTSPEEALPTATKTLGSVATATLAPGISRSLRHDFHMRREVSDLTTTLGINALDETFSTTVDIYTGHQSLEWGEIASRVLTTSVLSAANSSQGASLNPLRSTHSRISGTYSPGQMSINPHDVKIDGDIANFGDIHRISKDEYEYELPGQVGENKGKFRMTVRTDGEAPEVYKREFITSHRKE